MRFIVGMVKDPVITVFAIDEPEIIPIIPDASTLTFAGPQQNGPPHNEQYR